MNSEGKRTTVHLDTPLERFIWTRPSVSACDQPATYPEMARGSLSPPGAPRPGTVWLPERMALNHLAWSNPPGRGQQAVEYRLVTLEESLVRPTGRGHPRARDPGALGRGPVWADTRFHRGRDTVDSFQISPQ